MLTTRNTGLVSGVGLPSTPLVTVRALRGFFDQQRTPRRAGELVQVTERFAMALISTHKAERYVAPPQPAISSAEPRPEPTKPAVPSEAIASAKPPAAPAVKKVEAAAKAAPKRP